jgi:exonuclease VII large subunit
VWEQRAAETAERHREAIDAVVDSMEKQRLAALELIGGDIAVREAQRQAATEVDELNTVLADQETTLGEASAAIDEAAEAQLTAARAAADYREDQLLANGSTVDGKVQAQLYQEELQRIVDKLDGPLKAALQTYLNQLAAIPDTLHTTLILDTPGRVGDFAAPEVGGQFALNGAAGSPVINVNVTTTGEVAPSKIVDAIDKYYRFNAPR